MPAVKNTTIADNILSPKENPNFIGHETATATLTHSFASNALPNGWLLCGPKGIGKATLAYRFARHILSGGTSENMNVPVFHPAFGRIKAGSHSDLLVLETGHNEITGKTANEITVDEVRKIGGFLRLTASQTPYRVVIIDSADQMNTNAANAVLKLLEEPPANTVMLLISHSPGKLLPTIRSRCRALKMHAPSHDEALAVVRLCAPGIPPDDAANLLTLSENSPGVAIQLYQSQGLELYDIILSILAAPSADRIWLAHDLGDRLTKKESIETWHAVTYLLRWFMAQIIRCSAKAPSESTLSKEEHPIIQMILAKYSLENILQIWEKVGRLLQDTESKNLDKKSVIVTIFESLRT